MVSPAQDTPNDSKLAPQPDEGYDSKCNATTEGGGSKVLGATVLGARVYKGAPLGDWLLLRALWLGPDRALVRALACTFDTLSQHPLPPLP